MNTTAIWNTLKTTGSYTPAWTPNNSAESCKACEAVCEALATDKVVDHIKGCGNITTYLREGIKFMVYCTYDFTNFSSSEDPGFAESRHYTIKTLKH